MTSPTVILALVSGFDSALEARALPLLSPSRRGKLARLKTEDGRAQCVCAELALLCALSEGTKSAARAAYEYGENGKPYLRGENGGYISFSHAGRAGACAWSAANVGADIERRDRVIRRLRPKLLSPGETDEDDAALLEIWCAKESFVKLTGEGLSRPFTGISAQNGGIADAAGRRLARFETGVEGEYLWALCAREAFQARVLALTAREALSILGA